MVGSGATGVAVKNSGWLLMASPWKAYTVIGYKLTWNRRKWSANCFGATNKKKDEVYLYGVTNCCF